MKIKKEIKKNIKNNLKNLKNFYDLQLKNETFLLEIKIQILNKIN